MYTCLAFFLIDLYPIAKERVGTLTMKCPKCQFDNPDDILYCGKCATPLKSSEDISVSHTKTLETSTGKLTRGTTFASRYEIIEKLVIHFQAEALKKDSGKPDAVKERTPM